MKQKAISLFFIILMGFLFPSPSYAVNTMPRCLKTLAVTFYDGVYLDQALNMHRVYQSTWSPIRNELKRRARRVPELMYQEGKKLRPNPLDHPFNPKEAEKIFIKVLFQQFQETLNDFDVMNRGNIRDMFDYIRLRQQDKIDACVYPR